METHDWVDLQAYKVAFNSSARRLLAGHYIPVFVVPGEPWAALWWWNGLIITEQESLESFLYSDNCLHIRHEKHMLSVPLGTVRVELGTVKKIRSYMEEDNFGLRRMRLEIDESLRKQGVVEKLKTLMKKAAK